MRGCTEQRGTAYEAITTTAAPKRWRCPKGLLNPDTPSYDPGLSELLAVAADAEALHALPGDGGLDSQPAWAIEACRVVRSTQAGMMNYRREATRG